MERLRTWMRQFSEKKQKMGLENAGPLDNLHKEARHVSLTPYLFEGGKLDLGKMMSNNFQLNHSFNLGSSSVPPSYHFGTVFVGAKNFLQGMVDNKGDLQGKFHYAWSDQLMAKVQLQLSQRPGYSMYQLETEYLGPDYTLNGRAINFDPSQGTGIFSTTYLQSISKAWMLGVEGLLQKPMSDLEEASMSLFARWQNVARSSIFTVTLQNLVGLQASYYHKVTDHVELATELQALLAGPQMEALANVGCKLEYRQATVRAQVDSLGKMAVFLEERLMGRMALLLSGEIDHVKGRSKFGVGLSIEN